MKKIILTFMCLLIASVVKAEIILMDTGVTVENYWNKCGIEVTKVNNVARKLIHENGLKRASIRVERNWRVANASTSTYSKSIIINTGMLPYISNDDELAFVLGHELAHAQDGYDGVCKLIAMRFNSKKYEYKADLKAIDYMVNAGYNPVAAIIISNKIFDEPLWDWGFTSTHPKGSKRLIKMYEYIYKKYPSYLNTRMASDFAFVDFLKNYEKELNSFYQKQERKNKSL